MYVCGACTLFTKGFSFASLYRKQNSTIKSNKFVLWKQVALLDLQSLKTHQKTVKKYVYQYLTNNVVAYEWNSPFLCSKSFFGEPIEMNVNSGRECREWKVALNEKKN